MDIRNYFSGGNRNPAKPEKRKIDEKSPEKLSTPAKKSKTKILSPSHHIKNDEDDPLPKGKSINTKKEKNVKKNSPKISKSTSDNSKEKKVHFHDSDDQEESSIGKKKEKRKIARFLDSDDEEEKQQIKKKKSPVKNEKEQKLNKKKEKVFIKSDEFFESSAIRKKSEASPKKNDSSKNSNGTVVNKKSQENKHKNSPIKKVKDEKSPGKKIKEEKSSEKKIKEEKPTEKKIKSSNQSSPIKQLKKSSPKKSTTQCERTERTCNGKMAALIAPSRPEPLPPSGMWVDKYKPKSISQVIGQQGDKSSAKKLLKWLTNWYKNKDTKAAYGNFNKSDDGAGFKAALLSGPPGIGKTTSAHLAAKECNFDLVEFNASDTRNKKSMEDHVKTLMSNKSLATSSSSKCTTTKHLLIMDEVDGMGGNADRGGVAELIQMIKNTKIPVICICNDRNNPKIRSLANYCFDLRFQRPRVEQIKGAMMSICFKEEVKIDPNTLNDLIESSNHDVRQVLHYLSLYTSKKSKIVKSSSSQPIKDVKLGPFDAVKKMFTSGPEYDAMSFQDRSDLFFSDYSLMPLFAFENYIKCIPAKNQKETDKLKMAAMSASAISFSDLVETEIRSRQTWSLLPLQAAFSTVMPGHYMNGHFSGMIAFPSLLGKISSFNKKDRLLQELKQHMNLKVSGSKSALNLDYLLPLRNKLLAPLQNGDSNAANKTIEMLHEYNLRKDDIESIIELTLWTGDKNPFASLDSKTKAAFTRAYNKTGEFLPYATEDMFKKAKVKGVKEPKEKASKKKTSTAEEEEDIVEDDEDYIPDF